MSEMEKSSRERVSTRFTGIFLAPGLYSTQVESRPANLRLTQTVSLLYILAVNLRRCVEDEDNILT